VSEEEAVVEQVADAIENAGEEAAEVVRSLTGLKLSFAAFGFAVGVATGALIAYKRAELKYKKFADDEIAAMRAHYRNKGVVDHKKPDLDDVVQGLGYATKNAPEVTVPGAVAEEVKEDDEPEPETEPLEVNVFDENLRGLSTDVWNHDQEVASRTPHRAYVIHKEEFREGEYDSETLTYYIQDDVLTDERDQRMTDIDSVVALENLEKFGHGSEDANVVYIRNDKLQMDYEILRSGGSYTSEVLGVVEPEEEDELRHSGVRRRRPRFDDD
jgi:hypothetical protein